MAGRAARRPRRNCRNRRNRRGRLLGAPPRNPPIFLALPAGTPLALERAQRDGAPRPRAERRAERGDDGYGGEAGERPRRERPRGGGARDRGRSRPGPGGVPGALGVEGTDTDPVVRGVVHDRGSGGPPALQHRGRRAVRAPRPQHGPQSARTAHVGAERVHRGRVRGGRLDEGHRALEARDRDAGDPRPPRVPRHRPRRAPRVRRDPLRGPHQGQRHGGEFEALHESVARTSPNYFNLSRPVRLDGRLVVE